MKTKHPILFDGRNKSPPAVIRTIHCRGAAQCDAQGPRVMREVLGRSKLASCCTPRLVNGNPSRAHDACVWSGWLGICEQATAGRQLNAELYLRLHVWTGDQQPGGIGEKRTKSPLARVECDDGEAGDRTPTGATNEETGAGELGDCALASHDITVITG